MNEIVDLSEQEATEYLAGLGVKTSGVGELIRAVYHLLGLRTYLTTGEQETRHGEGELSTDEPPR